MNQLQNAVLRVGINPVDSANTTTAGTAFDTRLLGGVGIANVIVQIGNIAANSTSLKIEQSVDNSTWTDLTSASWTAPLATGGDNTIYLGSIKMGNVARYLRVSIAAGAGATLVSAIWIGEGVAQTPNSNTERGTAAFFSI
jgi:hypothetical protein